MLVRDKLITIGWKNKIPVKLTNTDILEQDLIIPRFHALLLKAEIIVADRAIEKFYTETKREYWEYEKHFDCVLPPFNLFFLETKKPSFIKSDTAYTEASKLSPSWGVLFQEVSSRAGFSEQELSEIFNKLGLQRSKGNWLYALNFVYDEPNRKDSFIFPDVTSFVLVNENGKIIRNPKMLFHGRWGFLPKESEVMREVTNGLSLSAFYCLDMINSLQWKLDKKYTSSILSGSNSQQATHYNLLIPY